jgi:hypothetical protein
MKGIKECINWLINNEGKELIDSNSWYVKYENGSLHTKCCIDAEYRPFSSLYEFDEREWLEVKQPYTFLEAYEDCKNTKTSYIRPGLTPNDICLNNMSGDVYIEYDKNRAATCIVLTDGDWYKK